MILAIIYYKCEEILFLNRLNSFSGIVLKLQFFIRTSNKVMNYKKQGDKKSRKNYRPKNIHNFEMKWVPFYRDSKRINPNL